MYTHAHTPRAHTYTLSHLLESIVLATSALHGCTHASITVQRQLCMCAIKTAIQCMCSCICDGFPKLHLLHSGYLPTTLGPVLDSDVCIIRNYGNASGPGAREFW